MKLTISLITMNRASQLKEALESCATCELPEDTQFVIIDNASTDNTKDVVEQFFNDNVYNYYYEKHDENVGAGIGRNIAFANCKGEYVYFLDDDAYIDYDKYPDFFIRAIKLLDDNPKLATLTTQIYDLMWKKNRINNNGPKINGILNKCYMVCGGSHFLRRKVFEGTTPYFPNKYGYEELQPSLRAADKGLLNGFTDELIVIHNPKANKWQFDKGKNSDILIGEIVCQKVIKGSVYPVSVYPLVCLAYYLRSRKHLSMKYKKIADEQVLYMSRKYNFGKRIKLRTVMKLFRDFGFSIF